VSIKNYEINLFAGQGNLPLAQKISEKLDIPIGDCRTAPFADGELNLTNRDNSHGKNVFIIQSTSSSEGRTPNDNLMELLMMGKSAMNAGAYKIIAVIPYFGYARQDRTVDFRDCITSQLCAEMIENAGFHKVLLMDLHSQQIQGFFHKSQVYGISGKNIIKDYFLTKFENNPKEDFVVVAPDEGSFKNAYKLSQKLGTSIAFAGKDRSEANKSSVVASYGDVKNKICLIQDDIIDTAGTICNAAENLKARGAKEIYVAATHGVLSGPAIERLEAAPINEIALLETIAISPEKRIKKMKILETAEIFAEYILKIHYGFDLDAPIPELSNQIALPLIEEM